MNPFWRNLTVTFAAAIIAGAVGGWIGARTVSEDEPQQLPLRQTVHQIVSHDLKLSPVQNQQIRDIESKYYDRRTALRQEVASADRELADALMADMAFGREAQQAANHVEHGLGQLQRATIRYVLEVRDTLTPEQQMVYDRKVREVLTASASPKS